VYLNKCLKHYLFFIAYIAEQLYSSLTEINWHAFVACS